MINPNDQNNMTMLGVGAKNIIVISKNGAANQSNLNKIGMTGI